MSLKSKIKNLITSQPGLLTFGIGLAIVFGIGIAVGMPEIAQAAAKQSAGPNVGCILTGTC